jgi:hypothetical protein
MPSSSPAQKRTMAAVAHGWKPDNPKIARIPVKVAKEFNHADKLRARGVVSNKAHAKMKHPELRGRISNG